MILRIDILHKALSYAQKQFSKTHKKPYVEKVILLDPTGSVFTQNIAQSFIQVDHIILICGHYEGMDARIEHYVDEKISIGEYVLTGGEIPALVISDAVTRLIPGVLSKPQAVIHESFSIPHTHEEPHYTRPRIFKGHSVPEILLSGNHKKICSWRKEKSALKPTT